MVTVTFLPSFFCTLRSICLFLAFVVQTAKNDLNRDFLFQYQFTIIFRKKDPSAESEVLCYLVLPLQVPNFQDLLFHSFILFTLLLRIHL